MVTPTLFGGVEAVHEALENLEVKCLANREAHLHFAVLGFGGTLRVAHTLSGARTGGLHPGQIYR